MGVNLYVTLPPAGHPGHGSFFSNGPLLALHAVLGILLMLAAIAMLVRGDHGRPDRHRAPNTLSNNADLRSPQSATVRDLPEHDLGGRW